MYIRLVVGDDHKHHRGLQGVFHEIDELYYQGLLDKHEEERLRKLRAWLNKNLPVPPFSKSDWPDCAVCWFKDSATEMIAQVWELVVLLREHGQPVRMLRSRNPGKVLFEDDYQVVVVEWREL
jgi:hypothetical protein